MTLYTQDPGEKRKYRATISNDTISSSTFSATPSGLTIGAPAETSTTTTALVTTSGATVGTVYTLTANIVGASGQVYERSCKILVEQL